MTQQQTTATATREYKLGPVALAFVHDFTSDVAGIIGPYGSGKSTLIALKILTLLAQTVPDSDGVRRVRALVLRGTFSMIKSALLPVMQQHLPPGTKFTQDSPITADYKTASVQLHIDFIALDRDDDIRRLQGGSYDCLFVDEARDTTWPIVQTAMTRVRAVTDQGKPKPLTVGIVSNPSDETHWLYKHFVEKPLPGWKLYKQPSGLSDEREGPYNASYYKRIMDSNRDDEAYIRVHVHGDFGLWVPAGDAVVSAFKSGRHFAELNVSPILPLMVGLDVGVAYNALVFAQRQQGQIRVIGELVIENKAAVMAAPAAHEYVEDWLQGAPVGLCTIDPSSEQRSADTGRLVVDTWRAATKWKIHAAPSPRIAERVTALNGIFAANNSDGNPAILVDPRKCPVLARALMGEYRWKLRRTAGQQMQSVDGELDKANRPYADAGDALGYLVMGAGAHAGLVDFARQRPGRRSFCVNCGRSPCACSSAGNLYGF